MPGEARVLPADADVGSAGLAGSVLADPALTADARLPLGPAWVGMSCCAERYRQEEHVLVASRGQKVRTVQSALHPREKEKLLC